MNMHHILRSAGVLNKARAFISADAELLSVWSRMRPGNHSVDISYAVGGCARVVSLAEWRAAGG